MRGFFLRYKKLGFVAVCSSLVALSGCSYNEEFYSGDNPNKVYVACGSSCRTVSVLNTGTLTAAQRETIRQFVRYSRHHHPVYVSLCATNTYDKCDAKQTRQQLNEVVDMIDSLGYQPVVVRETIPNHDVIGNCINLVRGKLSIVPPTCPYLKDPLPPADRISSNFGCATNRNFGLMLINPWDLLAQPGESETEASRVGIGMKKYREGIKAKLDVDDSSKIEA